MHEVAQDLLDNIKTKLSKQAYKYTNNTSLLNREEPVDVLEKENERLRQLFDLHNKLFESFKALPWVVAFRKQIEHDYDNFVTETDQRTYESTSDQIDQSLFFGFATYKNGNVFMFGYRLIRVSDEKYASNHFDAETGVRVDFISDRNSHLISKISKQLGRHIRYRSYPS